MTALDYKLEELYKSIANRPNHKFEETITSFDRNIYYYDRDEVARQLDLAERTPEKVTYEDHRKVVETAVNMFRKDTAHTIAMHILTHRFFKEYRAKAFRGTGSFNEDYSFLVKKAGMLVSVEAGRVYPINIGSKLKSFTAPTLVQINHITGDITPVTLPTSGVTLQEWAVKFNSSANESTTYKIAGVATV